MNTTPPESRTRPMRFVPFALALICFVLPFLEVSCQGQKFVAMTGAELVTGRIVESRDAFTGQTKSQKFESDPRFMTAVISLCLAATLCLIPGAAGKLFASIAGVATLALFLFGKFSIEADAAQKGQGAFVCSWLIGFWLASLLILIGVIVCVWQFFEAQQKEPVGNG